MRTVLIGIGLTIVVALTAGHVPRPAAAGIAARTGTETVTPAMVPGYVPMGIEVLLLVR